MIVIIVNHVSGQKLKEVDWDWEEGVIGKMFTSQAQGP